MTECRHVDSLVTPYVDGQASPSDAGYVERHLRVCGPCRGRVAAEQAVHVLLRARHESLTSPPPPAALRARCSAIARPQPRPVVAGWRSRVLPLGMAASLVIVVAGAFLYEATVHSTQVMAAELTADHLKCFRVLNNVLGTHHEASAVERTMASAFGWQMRLPEHPERVELELVGARPCLYPQGKIAHIMYRHNGHPVSVFMLPKSARSDEVVEVMGHQAAVWSVANRTFVLITNEPRADIERMTSFVHAALR